MGDVNIEFLELRYFRFYRRRILVHIGIWIEGIGFEYFPKLTKRFFKDSDLKYFPFEPYATYGKEYSTILLKGNESISTLVEKYDRMMNKTRIEIHQRRVAYSMEFLTRTIRIGY